MSYSTKIFFKILSKPSKKTLSEFLEFPLDGFSNLRLAELIYTSSSYKRKDGFEQLDFEEIRWGEECINSFKELSAKFPKVRFAIKGFGENHEDIWIEYYQNSFVQEEQAKIVYPRFNSFYFKKKKIDKYCYGLD